MIKFFLSNLPAATAGLFLLSFAGTYLRSLMRKKEGAALESALVNGISLSSAPTGCAFIICAFQPEYLSIIGDQTLSFIIAGAVILYIAMKYGIPK